MNDLIASIEDHPDTFIAKSDVQGNGLFASRDFKANETILDYSYLKYKLHTLPWVELTQQQREINWYIPINEKFCMTFDIPCKFNFINHSRDANCNWYIDKLLINAKRPIKKGEELFIDYRVEVRPNRAGFPAWI